MKRSKYTLRRLLALALVLVMVGSLFAGCSKKAADPTVPSQPDETIAETAAPTNEPTDAPTEAPTETEPDQINIDKGGCGSAIGFSALALLALGGVLLIKRRED